LLKADLDKYDKQGAGAAAVEAAAAAARCAGAGAAADSSSSIEGKVLPTICFTEVLSKPAAAALQHSSCDALLLPGTFRSFSESLVQDAVALAAEAYQAMD